MPENGWDRYQILVLDKLDTLKGSVGCKLKVKAGIFGAVAGFLGAAVPVLAALGVYLLKG
jgi:hypothetical protein